MREVEFGFSALMVRFPIGSMEKYIMLQQTHYSKIITSTSFIDMFEDNDHKLWFVSQNEFIIADGNKIMKPDPKLLLAHGIVLNGATGQIVLTQNSGYQLKHNSTEIFKYNIKFKTKMNGGIFETQMALFYLLLLKE